MSTGMWRPFNSVPFVFDVYLKPNEFKQDMNGIWHIGDGTDLKVLTFQLNLTAGDRQWLKSMHIDSGKP